jgi:hypothetical protein
VRKRFRKRIYKVAPAPVAAAPVPRRPIKTPSGRPRGRPRKTPVPPEAPSSTQHHPREGLRTRATAATAALPPADVSNRFTHPASPVRTVRAPVSGPRPGRPRIKPATEGPSGSPLSVLARACARLSAEDELNPLVFSEPVPTTLKERHFPSPVPLGPQRRAVAKASMTLEKACASLSFLQNPRASQRWNTPEDDHSNEFRGPNVQRPLVSRSAALPQPYLLNLLKSNRPIPRLPGASCPSLWTGVPLTGTDDRPANAVRASAYSGGDAFMGDTLPDLSGALSYWPMTYQPGVTEHEQLDSLDDVAILLDGDIDQPPLLQGEAPPSAEVPDSAPHDGMSSGAVPLPGRSRAGKELVVSRHASPALVSTMHQADTVAWSLATNFGFDLTEAKKMAQQTLTLPPPAQSHSGAGERTVKKAATFRLTEGLGAYHLDHASQTSGEGQQAWLQQFTYPPTVLSPVSGRRQAARFPAPAASASNVPTTLRPFPGLIAGSRMLRGALPPDPRSATPAVAAQHGPRKVPRKRLRTGEENDESRAVRGPAFARHAHLRALGAGVHMFEGASRPVPERSLSTADEDSCELPIDELCIEWPSTSAAFNVHG